MKACCGFGHRNVFDNISRKLDNAVEAAIQQGCEIFYTGAMGKFDSLFSSAVRVAKKSHPHIKLICVKPYCHCSERLNYNKSRYKNCMKNLIFNKNNFIKHIRRLQIQLIVLLRKLGKI